MPSYGGEVGRAGGQQRLAEQGPDGSAPPFYRIAELYFDSKAKMDKTLASQAGKDTVADLPNFATGGFTIVISELAPRKRM